VSRSSSGSRIGVLGGAFLFALVVVLLHLWLLMVNDREAWARRSYENRWAFRSVPSQRGALRDRFGRVLARDQATSEVSIYYERFRKYNVVGAAVHAAIEWTRLRPGHPEVRFGYYEGGAGPTAAAQELLAMPVAALRRGVLSKEDASKLWLPVVTVLSGCSGLSRSQAYTALRSAAEAGVDAGIGDVLELPRAALLDAFDERLRALQTLDLRIADAQARRADRLGLPADELKGLFETLEMLRVASLEKRHHYFLDDGERKQGSLLEQITRVFAVDVEFELAAALRVDSDLYTGIDVFPSVTRVYAEGPGTSLRVLLGRVLDYDRSIGEEEEETWFRDVEKDLRDDWLEQLVPDGIVAGDEARAKLRETARRRYEREVLSRERRGVTGFEAAFDRGLSGKLGMRFVEHDAKHREQLLWSHLRVESGDDVQVTIDADLQRVAEGIANATYQRVAGGHRDESDRKLVEAAITLIDARTGDVLCYAGAPIVSRNARDVPGVVWTGNGAIGSVVKPLVMVEHLECVRSGLPHRPVSEMEECDGGISRPEIRAKMFKCDGAHRDDAFDPAFAIAHSCNVFFYQAGLGLGNAGLRRALLRFGMLEPDGEADAPFAACWQDRIAGLSAAQPRMHERRVILIQRSIGYGIDASPVHVARAYAGLGTLALPTLGLRAGEQRPRVSLEAFAESIGIVNEGLRDCVQEGTASRLGAVLKQYDVHAKTGTAEVGSRDKENNAWFAGYLPFESLGGVQLAFCAVCYWVPHGEHGADVAGKMVADLLTEMQRDDRLRDYYLTPRND